MRRYIIPLPVFFCSWFTLLASDTFSFNPLFISTPPLQPSARRIYSSPWHVSVSSSSFSTSDKGITSVCLRMALEKDADSSNDEDEEEEDPLSKGIDSVSWLPSVKEKQPKEENESKSPDLEVLPMFPLGVYTPQSNQVLNIFEPRYRKMYNDILMNGSKRFVVTMSHPTDKGKFAQIGVIFQLEDLKEVSELTADQVKYICDHRVTDRVKVHRILNPEAWETRETYLQVEATRLKEEDDEGTSKERKGINMINPRDVYLQIAKAATGGIGEMETEEEKLLRKSFSTLVELQYELQEDVRFTKASINTLKVKRGSGKDSLWETVRLWQAYSDNRLQARQADLQKEFQEKLLKFLQNQKKEKDEKIPSIIDYSSLSPELQKDVQELEKRMTMELKPLALESTLAMQKILEAESHKKRVNMVRYFVDAECKRLQAKTALRGMFSTPTVEKKEEKIQDTSNIDKRSLGGSVLFDEPDAFQ